MQTERKGIVGNKKMLVFFNSSRIAVALSAKGKLLW